jgi:pimeloyl-ACP methyl ester carboxylesterase
MVFAIGMGLTAGAALGDPARQMRMLVGAGLVQLPGTFVLGAFAIATWRCRPDSSSPAENSRTSARTGPAIACRPGSWLCGGQPVSHARSAQHEVVTVAGRVLLVELSGAAGGVPVILLHGMPGSRRGPKPRSSVLYRLGVRLISYDRPGYGGSERHEGRRVADAATDVEAIANDLRLDRFAVVGRSGGGPHALACAALLPERVTRTAVLVGLAPSHAAGLDWYAGMTNDNVSAYSAAESDVAVLADRLRVRAERAVGDPETLIELLQEEMTGPDRQVLMDVAMRRLFGATYLEALRDGPYGWIDDVLALRGEWGFDLGNIAGPVRFWHGAEDNFTPAGHARWLASQIPGAELRVQTDMAHFGVMRIFPEVLAWLAAPAEAERRSNLRLSG